MVERRQHNAIDASKWVHAGAAYIRNTAEHQMRGTTRPVWKLPPETQWVRWAQDKLGRFGTVAGEVVDWQG